MLQKSCTSVVTMVRSSSSETTKEDESQTNPGNCTHLPSRARAFSVVSGISSVTDAKETEARLLSRDAKPTSVVRTAKFKTMKSMRCSSDILIPPDLKLSDLLDSPILQPIDQAEPFPSTGTTRLSSINQGKESRSGCSLESLTKNLTQNGHENILYKPVPSVGRKGLPSISMDSRTVAKGPLKALGLASSFSAHAGFTPQVWISAENPQETCSKVGQSQLIVQTPLTPVEVSSEDGYHWRKYGQKSIKDSKFPRSYYRCAHPSCPVKKMVEQSKTVTKGEHNHSKPQTVKRMSPGALLSTNRSINNGSVAIPLSADKFNAHLADDISTKHRASISSSHKAETLLSITSSLKSEPLLAISASPKTEPLLASTVDGDKTGLKWSRVEGPPKVRSKLQNDKYDLKKRLKLSETGTKPSVQITHRVEQIKNTPGGGDDGYRWCKYGQKLIKGNSHPRSYYKCQSPGCPVRKHVERSSVDDNTVISTYEGKHNHDAPASRFNISTLSPSSNLKNSMTSVSPPHPDGDSPDGNNAPAAPDRGFGAPKRKLSTGGEKCCPDTASGEPQCANSSLGVSSVDPTNSSFLKSELELETNQKVIPERELGMVQNRIQVEINVHPDIDIH